MRARVTFTLVGCASVIAGTALFLATRPSSPIAPPEIGAGAIYAASFRTLEGQPASLGRFAGRPVVLNFWATWCAPCREEMPTLSRLATRLQGQVQFVGLSQDSPDKVRQFVRQVAVSYPLWAGDGEVMDFSARLGNRQQVLPFTVILDASGRVAAQKVGAYSEPELASILADLPRNGTNRP